MNWQSTNITAVFLQTVRTYPDNTAFHYYQDGWKTITYSELGKEVKSLASYLMNAGLKPGDRVAVVSENRPEWCSAYLSILMAGGVAVPVDAQLSPGEIRNLLLDSGSRAVFHSRKTSDSISAALTDLPEGKSKPLLRINFDSPGYASISGTEPAERFPEKDPDDIASIIYTSGTTGVPKGVMLTHRNFCSDAEALIAADVVSHEDNVLSVLPLHHTYAFMCTFLVPAFLGASMTYPASLKGPDIISAIRETGVSVLIGVPQLLGLIRNGMLQRISSLPKPVSFILLKVLRISGLMRERLGVNIGRLVFRSAHRALGSRFRFFGSGGARLDPAIMRDLEALGFAVVEGYGLTETSPVVTFNPVNRRKPGSTGKALPSVEIKILDPSENGEGEIAVKGPMVMKGYYNNPAATADVIRDGWFRTGDIGMLDSEGYLFITGRLKEVIVLSSGKNIYPEDVEKLYMGVPLIKEICVTGVEKDGITEAIHGIIVPDLEYARKAGISNIQEAIRWEINSISPKIPSYMRITGFSVRTESLPRTPLGKLRRFMIKEGAAPVAPEEKERGKGEELFADDTSRKVREELSRFVKEGQAIGIDDNLELDIGLDSLSKIELVVSLEKAFAAKLPEDFISDVQTVRELIGKIKGLAAAGYQAGAAAKTGWKEILSREPEGGSGLISLEGPRKRMLPARIIHPFLKLLFKILFRLETEGVGNIPSDRNFILAPNHASYLDGPSVILSLPFSVFRNLYSLGLSDFFTGIIKSRFAKTAHVIPIDSTAYLNKALQMSAYVLKNEGSLSVFPEGGRSFDGSLMEFKKGVGILAVEMGVPVVPVYIKGAFEALPRSSVLPRPGKIKVIFGKPLLASELDFSKKPEGIDDYQYFADVLKERVRELGEHTQS